MEGEDGGTRWEVGGVTRLGVEGLDLEGEETVGGGGVGLEGEIGITQS